MYIADDRDNHTVYSPPLTKREIKERRYIKITADQDNKPRRRREETNKLF